MRASGGVVAAFLICGVAFASESGWQEYSYPEAGFAAQYPGQPTVGQRDYKTTMHPDGMVRERTYAFDSGGVVYEVKVADFGTAHPDQEKAIDEAAKNLIAQGMVTHDVSGRIDFHYGREIRVEDSKGTSYTDAIFFIEGKLYQIEVTYPAMNTDPNGSSGIHFFQQAFRLLN
jgi:hypothetical protein